MKRRTKAKDMRPGPRAVSKRGAKPGRRRTRESVEKAIQTAATRRAHDTAPLQIPLPRRVAETVRIALGVGDVHDPAVAAVQLKPGEHLLWETSRSEFRRDMTALSAREPTYKDMRFELQPCTTFINAALAFETLFIKRVE